MLTPRQFLDTRAGTHCAIGLILLVGASTGLTGLGWGLPSSQRAALLGGSVAACRAELSSRSERDLDTRRGQGTIFRAAPLEDEFDLPRVVRRFLLFTDSPDEALTLLALANLRPRQLDFNPRIVQYGGVHVYGTGAALAVAHTIHFGRITGDVGHYADRPQDIARLYVAGRLLIVCYNIGIALVLFAFGREAAGSLCGVVAALCWLLSPAAVAFSHIINPHLPAAVFATLAAWLSWRAAHAPARAGGWIAAGAACGAAASCAPNAALALLAPWSVAAFGWRREPRVAAKCIVIAFIAAAASYLAFNPYIFANVGVLVSERERFREFFPATVSLSGLSEFARATLPSALGYVGLGVVVLGATRWWRRGGAGGRALVVFAVVGVVVAATMTGTKAGEPASVRFAMLVLPLLWLPVAVALTSNWSWWLRATIGLAIAVELLWNGAGYLRSYLRSPRDEAGAYINAHMPSGASILVPRSPSPYKTPAFDFQRVRVVTDLQEDAEYLVRVESTKAANAPSGYVLVASFPSEAANKLTPLSFSGRIVRLYRRVVSAD